MEWNDYVEEVRARGFGKASPLARLIWACDVGDIDQHASADLKRIAAELARLQRVESIAQYLIVNNKRNFTIHDTDGVISATIGQLEAALKG